MGYRVVEANKLFHVMEEKTIENNVSEVATIKSFSDRQEAKVLMRRLNGGSGFNGWTPNFFLREVTK